MSQNKDKRKLIFVMGATASGKSDLALDLQMRLGGVIFNCDSIQVYKHLNIGSAKPSSDDLKRAPHYLYDFVDFPMEYGAGDYRRDFLATIQSIPSELPVFVVGGTGFYFQAIEKGMYSAPVGDPYLRELLEQEVAKPEGRKLLYEELLSRDPALANKIHIQDSYRITRALEVMRQTGKKWSEIQTSFELQAEQNTPFEILKIFVQRPRAILRERIALRVDKMLAHGLVDEVKELRSQGIWFNPESKELWSPLQSVGYKQVVEYLNETRSDQWLRDEIILRTAQLAKRQETWFKRDRTALSFFPDGKVVVQEGAQGSEVQSIQGFSDLSALVDEICLRGFGE